VSTSFGALGVAQHADTLQPGQIRRPYGTQGDAAVLVDARAGPATTPSVC
jgi:hypothetical protein